MLDGATFLAYVEPFLAPTLAPGDVVVLDNLSSHKVSGVREAIEACGATLLYLPPCSPDLNPIELAFSKLKRRLRDAAERTVEALWKTIRKLPDQCSPTECANYIRYCGFIQSERYRSTGLARYRLVYSTPIDVDLRSPATATRQFRPSPPIARHGGKSD